MRSFSKKQEVWLSCSCKPFPPPAKALKSPAILDHLAVRTCLPDQTKWRSYLPFQHAHLSMSQPGVLIVSSTSAAPAADYHLFSKCLHHRRSRGIHHQGSMTPVRRLRQIDSIELVKKVCHFPPTGLNHILMYHFHLTRCFSPLNASSFALVFDYYPLSPELLRLALCGLMSSNDVQLRGHAAAKIREALRT